MKTWLTYLAAVLMAGATAFAFPSSTVFLSLMERLTAALTNVAIFLFIPISFITLASAVASLKKDKIGGKTVRGNIAWAVVTSLVLALLAVGLFSFRPLSFPVTSTSGGKSLELFSSYTTNLDIFGTNSFLSSHFLPLVFLALICGAALKPSSDIIKPAYTVMNSFAEVMFRIEKTVAYFGALYVYVAASAFFVGQWQEKTIFDYPSFFLTLLISAVVIIAVVIPLLYAFFTGFKKNPYTVLGRSLSSLFFAFFSGNIYATALQTEALERTNLGVQKRIVNASVPFGIFFTRGGTAFVSTVTVLSLLSSLGGEITLEKAAIIALVNIVLSTLSFLSAGSEVALVSIALFKACNITVYGAEAAVFAVLPFLNGIATALDITLISAVTNIIARKTKTDIMVPARDVI